jgi:hypothetical protein
MFEIIKHITGTSSYDDWCFRIGQRKNAVEHCCFQTLEKNGTLFSIVQHTSRRNCNSNEYWKNVSNSILDLLK